MANGGGGSAVGGGDPPVQDTGRRQQGDHDDRAGGRGGPASRVRRCRVRRGARPPARQAEGAPVPNSDAVLSSAPPQRLLSSNPYHPTLRAASFRRDRPAAVCRLGRPALSLVADDCRALAECDVHAALRSLLDETVRLPPTRLLPDHSQLHGIDTSRLLFRETPTLLDLRPLMMQSNMIVIRGSSLLA